jgi:nucleoside-diphosphate-sugar epimerase
MELKNKRLLLIGGAGLIGSHIVDCIQSAECVLFEIKS